MDALDIAILRTLIYGDIFNFPMTCQEIHHFLIHDKPVDLSVIEKQLIHSLQLQQFLCTDGQYYALKQRQALLTLRPERERMMQSLSKRMVYYGRLLSYFPFVELVGITGALSMRNPSSANDDLDYLVIARPGRVWLARATIILLVKLMRLRNIEICPNYILASDKLLQSRQDLYIAHEIAQILPLSNLELYQQLRNENTWSIEHLPNATQPFYTIEESLSRRVGLIFKHGLETILSSPIGSWLEAWEYRRKVKRFNQQAQAPTASAQIDEGHVKGHFNDYGHYVLEQYHEKLKAYQLDAYTYVELQSVGD